MSETTLLDAPAGQDRQAGCEREHADLPPGISRLGDAIQAFMRNQRPRVQPPRDSDGEGAEKKNRKEA